jgi:hypothetical protein
LFAAGQRGERREERGERREQKSKHLDILAGEAVLEVVFGVMRGVRRHNLRILA